MAINKSRMNPMMKFFVWFLAGTFALSIAAIPLSAFLSPTSSTTAPTASSQNTSQTIDSIGLTATPPIKAREASLTVEPKNYELLVQQAQGYFDWAAQVQQVTQGKTGQDVPIWRASLPYYARALQVKAGDPNVTTDYGVAQFYSGESTAAVQTVGGVVAKNPTFGPAVFNLGVFYLDLGQNSNAKVMFEKYLKMEPNGKNAPAAKDLLTRVK